MPENPEASVTGKVEGSPPEKKALNGYRQNEDWSYYYVLYHMLAHWAAFLTIFVLLVTIGVVWNVKGSTVAHIWGPIIGLLVLCAVELELVWCISRESSYLLQKLPIESRALELIEPLHKHPAKAFSLICLGAIGFTAWDILLVLGC
jgi:hypothetical protein